MDMVHLQMIYHDLPTKVEVFHSYCSITRGYHHFPNHISLYYTIFQLYTTILLSITIPIIHDEILIVDLPEGFIVKSWISCQTWGFPVILPSNQSID